MTYKFSDNYINLLDVSRVVCSDSGDSDYPYLLTVYFKSDGKSLGVRYQTKSYRDRIAADISISMNQCFRDALALNESQATRIISHEVEKVRRDIRTLKKLLTEKESAE